MTKNNLWRRAANFIGAIAYFTIATQWLWLLSTAVLPVLPADKYQEIFLPQSSTAVVEPQLPELSIPPFIQVIIGVLSVVFAIGVSLYAIYIVPRSVGRTSHKSVKKIATITVKQTTRHQPVKPKQKQRLITRYMWLLKFLALILPLALSLLPIYEAIGIEHHLVVIVAIFLAALSLVGLGLQLLIAFFAKVPLKNLW